MVCHHHIMDILAVDEAFTMGMRHHQKLTKQPRPCEGASRVKHTEVTAVLGDWERMDGCAQFQWDGW